MGKRPVFTTCVFLFALGIGIGVGLGLKLPVAYAVTWWHTGTSAAEGENFAGGMDEIVFGADFDTVKFDGGPAAISFGAWSGSSWDADIYYHDTTTGGWTGKQLDIWSEEKVSLATRSVYSNATPLSSVEVEKDGDVIIVIGGS